MQDSRDYQVLLLTNEQANWLKGVMQNPIWSDINEEDMRDRENRHYVFNNLKWKHHEG